MLLVNLDGVMKRQYTKKLSLIMVTLITMLSGYGVLYAWNWLTASTWDGLTAVKWNELVSKVSGITTDTNWNVWVWISIPESILHISKTATNWNDGYIKHRVARDSSYWWWVHVWRSRGTIENQTALQDGDILYYNSAAGHDGTIYKPSAILTRYVDWEVSDWVVSWAFSFDTYFNWNRRDSFDIRANWYIGIGTIDPKADLHIVSTWSGATLMLWSVHNVAALTPEIQLRANNWNNPKIGVASAHTYDAELWSYIQFINEGPYARKGIWFFTKQTANYTGTEVGTDVFERMRIWIDGDVWIWTASPNAKLDVVGNINMWKNVFTANNSTWHSLKYNMEQWNGGWTALVMCSNNTTTYQWKFALYFVRATHSSSTYVESVYMNGNMDMFSFRNNNGNLEVQWWDSLVWVNTTATCSVISMWNS